MAEPNGNPDNTADEPQTAGEPGADDPAEVSPGEAITSGDSSMGQRSTESVAEPVRVGSAISARARWAMVGAMAVIMVVLDQLTKAWALNSLEIGQPRSVLGPLQMNLAFNTGMAFSRGASSGPIIGLIAIAFTSAMIFFARSSTSKIQLVAMGVVIGGAVGNVLDRLLRVGALGSPPGGGFMSGAVVDFIDVQFWPIFNIADTAVVVGGFVLAISMLFIAEDDPGHTESSATASSTTAEPGAGVAEKNGRNVNGQSDARSD